MSHTEVAIHVVVFQISFFCGKILCEKMWYIIDRGGTFGLNSINLYRWPICSHVSLAETRNCIWLTCLLRNKFLKCITTWVYYEILWYTCKVPVPKFHLQLMLATASPSTIVPRYYKMLIKEIYVANIYITLCLVVLKTLIIHFQ